jgi:soluble lytic murein transglycosylase-like protein
MLWPYVTKVTLAGVIALVLLTLVIAARPPVPTAGTRSRSAEVEAAPAALVAVAAEAGGLTGVEPNVLLAISRVECNFGHCQSGLPEELVPADVRRHVDRRALAPGGATARLLGLPDGRRVGDWVNPQPVADGEHAMGFMQFLPSTWRQEVAVAPGEPRDPYRPRDSMVVAGSYLARLQRGAAGGGPHDLRGALAVYGGSTAYAGRVLALSAGE